MAPLRSLRLLIKRYKTIFKLLTILASMYIFLNLWSVEVMNYEIKHKPEVFPHGDDNAKDVIIDQEIKRNTKEIEPTPDHNRVGVRVIMPHDMRVERRLDPIGKKYLVVADDINRPGVHSDKAKEEDIVFDNKISDSESEEKNDGFDDLLATKDEKKKKVVEMQVEKQWQEDAETQDDKEHESNDDKNNDVTDTEPSQRDAEEQPVTVKHAQEKESLKKKEHDKARQQVAPIPTSDEDDDTDVVDDAFMRVLERQKHADTFEVDISEATFADNVTYPPFVAHAEADGPGEGGTGFDFAIGELTPQEIKQRKEDFNIHYFDEWVSRKISVRRTLMEARSDKCLDVTYSFQFPTISVVIVFYNEAWTTLIRSIHSVLDRSPQGVITEIVLLDDCSNMEHLKEPLERYIQPMTNIRLIRGKSRLGLIKARNLGFLYSQGDIIIFLDSHIECFEGWLEPLIEPIVKDHKVVTFPVINGIRKQDFKINRVMGLFLGGLNIKSLTFIWITRSPEGKLYSDSPTMPGGLYAISRKWFSHLGAYDPQLKLWGGENVEISLKIWMCGGTLLQAQCSHVGHVFRTQSPVAKENSAGASARNSVRIAEVWLDKYKHFFYERMAYNLMPFGSVKSRKTLREHLECQDFGWYLDTINPELKETMDVKSIYAGSITNQHSGWCLQEGDTHVKLAACMYAHAGQMWFLTTKGYLRVFDFVIASEPTAAQIMTSGANATKPLTLSKFNPRAVKSNQLRWKYDARQRLARLGTRECADVDSNHRLVLAPCSHSVSQVWKVQTRRQLQEFHRTSGSHDDIDWGVY